MKKISIWLGSLLFCFSMALSPLSYATVKKVDKHEGIDIKVNINKADLEELDILLIGVGKSKAQAIIDYRKTHGDFTKIEDLSNVKGIGAKLIEKNKNRIQL